LRKEKVGVRDSKTLKPVYLAVEPEFLKEEFDKLFDDIDELLKRELSHKEIFYFNTTNFYSLFFYNLKSSPGKKSFGSNANFCIETR
jgi:hypothetical protein